MKKTTLIYFISLIAFVFSSCSRDAESDIVQDSNQKRISIFPSKIQFLADGSTEEGNQEVNAIVTINPYQIKDMNWQASLADNSWARIETISIENDGLIEKGLKIEVDPNIGYRRITDLIIKLEDGTEQQFDIAQIGEKADAFINMRDGISHLEFMAEFSSSQTIFFDTNMDSYQVEVEDGVEWIIVNDLGENQIEISPKDNTAENAGYREAKIYIKVGTPETSEAISEIVIRQLAPDVFSFIWGPALPDYNNVSKAVKMKKLDEGLYSINAYFINGALQIGEYANETKYPQYYLMDNGQIGIIENESSVDTNIPVIDMEGMRALVLNLNTMVYTLERITTQNSMPDDELAHYPTKKYIARDGTMKEWIVAAIRWDGGDIYPKLGGKLVPSAQSATGGYNTTDLLPQHILDPKLNTAYEEAENGGQLQGDDTNGRIYAYSEMLTGVPRGGIDGAVNQTFPVGWEVGESIVDAVGNEIIVEYVTNAMMTGDNLLDETNNPTLKWQLQGICPYGYHIANAQDWIDLAYAMSEASQGDTYPVNKNELTYKQFMTTSQGFNNMAAWLRNTTNWENAPIADGADQFGFNYFPTGFRYLKQGWQMYGLRKQVWVPLLYNDTKAYRINVVINKNNHTYVDLRNVDNGNAILPFRCVRNYK